MSVIGVAGCRDEPDLAEANLECTAVLDDPAFGGEGTILMVGELGGTGGFCVIELPEDSVIPERLGVECRFVQIRLGDGDWTIDEANTNSACEAPQPDLFG